VALSIMVGMALRIPLLLFLKVGRRENSRIMGSVIEVMLQLS
jgi:hypothetical protein